MNNKIIRRFLTAGVLLLLIAAAILSSCSFSPDETKAPTTVAAETAKPASVQPVQTVYVTATPTPPPSFESKAAIETLPAVDTWEDGTYNIGTDLAAGEYVLIANNEFSAYLEIAADDSGEFEAIIYNDNFYNRTRVTLEEEEFFTFNNATMYRADEAPPVPREGDLPEGMYLVGTDIEAGVYELEATEEIGGYYAVFDNARHDKYGYISNFNFLEWAEVSVDDGDYLHVARAVILRPSGQNE
jgi:hypothetical protein